jgi:hypothetical protein
MTTRAATRTVEYRLLQLVVSHLSGDRLTVGLLHWDGKALRIASSRAPFAMIRAPHRAAIRETATEFLRSAHAVADRMETKSRLNLGLKEIFPVREGMGAALHWTPVASIDAHDAVGHFEELRASLHLDERTSNAERHVTRANLRARLVALGEELQPLAPSRVLVRHTVKHKQTFVSPVSWKNGKWHDAVPVTFDGRVDGYDLVAQRLVGLVELAIPLDHVPVIVAVLPSDHSSRARAESEAATVKECLVGRKAEVLSSGRGESGVDLAGLAARIRNDVHIEE